MNEKRNPGFIVRLLMLLMICCSAAAGAMAQTVVSGKITDKSTSDPLPGATVSITPNGGKTRLGVSDMDGKYRIDNLAAGQYRIKVSYMGYKTYEKSVSLGSSSYPLILRAYRNIGKPYTMAWQIPLLLYLFLFV